MILDTNAISAFFEGIPAVCDRIAAAEMPALPSIDLGEYRFGLAGSRLSAELDAKLGRLERFAQVLAVAAATARHYATIRRELKKAGLPIPENDLWIAALTRQHALPLLSDDAHFDHVAGIERISW